ncbi:MAG: DUF1963 domain-containing protein [Armatimonadetes bacterium]|nr:DUF1963 domain-containing protein [Armatimonadota bacterium]
MGLFSLIRNVLSREPETPIEQVRLENQSIISQIEALAVQAIAGFSVNYNTNSFTGGSPKMPSTMQWPTNTVGDLDFIAQLDLGDLPSLNPNYGLPKSGVLYFFVDYENCFAEAGPVGSNICRVLYAEDGNNSCSLRMKPSKNKFNFPKSNLGFKKVTSYPSSSSRLLESSEIPREVKVRWTDLFPVGLENAVQVMGYAEQLQTEDMELDVEAAHSGIKIYDQNRQMTAGATSLRSRREDWIMLAQFEGLDEVGCTWGDCGAAYFWIRKEDLQNLDFSNVWMVTEYL